MEQTGFTKTNGNVSSQCSTYFLVPIHHQEIHAIAPNSPVSHIHRYSTQEFTSPRVAEAFNRSEGLIGTASGTINGTDALHDYFHHAMKTVKGLHLELLYVTRGLHNTVAVIYKRENGYVVYYVYHCSFTLHPHTPTCTGQ